MTATALMANTEFQTPTSTVTFTPFVDDVRESLYHWHSRGLKTAVLTLINYEGSSPRPIGSQVVVNELGEAAGLISGSCLESSLITEAVDSIHRNTAKTVRYGRGSDYIDIKLPCGSGLDVLITPNLSTDLIENLYTALKNRKAIVWDVELSSFRHTLRTRSEGDEVRPRSPQLSRSELSTNMTRFTKVFTPLPRIVVVGEGAIFDYFLMLSQAFEGQVIAYSPRFSGSPKAITEPIERMHTFPLHRPNQFDTDWLDESSALVLLSHDHDWDTDILQNALSTPVRYVAALGSPVTHARRLALLQSAGVSEQECKRIKGPAGLNLGGRTPPEIALSILAEITQTRNRAH